MYVYICMYICMYVYMYVILQGSPRRKHDNRYGNWEVCGKIMSAKINMFNPIKISAQMQMSAPIKMLIIPSLLF
jgi:hypothetical protein